MKNKTIEILKIIFIIFFSSFIIFYRFPSIPQNLAFDEVESAKLALSLEKKPYTPYSPLATGHSTLYFYILLFSLKIFGINSFGLRLPSAVFGILSVLIFYLILKKFNDKLALLVSFLFFSSRWFFGFARFSFEATFLLFLELLSIYFLLIFLFYEEKKFKNRFFLPLFFSGLFAGLAFNSYLPGRIFFILPLLILILKFINLSFSQKQKSQNKINLAIQSFLYFLIPFIIIIIPLTLYFFKNPDTRVDQLFFWKNHEMTINQKIIGTLENVKSIFLMHFLKGDINGRHNYPGKPALNPILAILFFTGLIISLQKIFKKESKKNIYYFLFIIFYFLSLLPSFAVYPWENPNMLRTYSALPSIFFFVLTALENIFEKIKTKKTFQILFIAILLFSSFYEIRTYFKYQTSVFNQAFEIKYPLEKAIKINYEKN
ncbi:MAG: glycosyltransferase family 39 protein [Patescibacteria group bacterium]|nr:glycosyltransferase family 39 protein [Patescibacteria group bacterium]